MKKKFNNIFRFVALLLCFVMITSLVACNKAQTAVQTDVEEEAPAVSGITVLKPSSQEIEPLNASSDTMKVLVFASNVAKGNRVLESSVTFADVPVSDLPVDPITSVDDIIGKYILQDATKGSCVTASNLSSIDPYINMTGLGEEYVIINNIINANRDEKDMSVVIQKAIDENPGKTIYFPDGKYNLTRTLIIPAEEGKSVSLRLSNYATFGPATNWDSSCKALVQYGKPENEKTQPAAHTDYIMGGTFDCGGSLTAIEIYGGGRLFVNNVAIENSKIGIHLKPNAAYNTLEDINITGKDANGTKGLFVEGTNNSLINMRIYRVLRGVHLTGGDNVLINLHPLFSGRNSANAIGFHDESTGNRYNICYSDQYMVGFKMSSRTRSYFDTCYVYWWTGISYEIGFLCEGELNSIITDSFVNFQNGRDSECHYLYFVEDPNAPTTDNGAEEEEDDEENEGSSSSSSSSSTNGFATSSPKGKGKVVNPKVLNSRNSDSNYYQQFEYKYN